MKTIAGILFLATPLVASISIVVASARLAMVETGDPFDLAILGRGYLQTVDESRENPMFHRSLKLAINRDGQLCGFVKGSLRVLEPGITLPPDQERVHIAREGAVSIEKSGSWAQVGGISLNCFAGENIRQNEAEFQQNDEMGAASPLTPGQQGAGYLMQGYREQYVIPLGITNWIAITLAFITVAGYIWYAVVWLRQPSKPINLPPTTSHPS